MDNDFDSLMAFNDMGHLEDVDMDKDTDGDLDPNAKVYSVFDWKLDPTLGPNRDTNVVWVAPVDGDSGDDIRAKPLDLPATLPGRGHAATAAVAFGSEGRRGRGRKPQPSGGARSQLRSQPRERDATARPTRPPAGLLGMAPQYPPSEFLPAGVDPCSQAAEDYVAGLDRPLSVRDFLLLYVCLVAFTFMVLGVTLVAT